MISSISNYINIKNVDLNIKDIKESSLYLRDFLVERYSNLINPSTGASSFPGITGLFRYYNLLMYPLPGFNKLYFTIQKFFYELHPLEDEYYIQCWLNFYEKGDSIDWHHHWAPVHKGWHGFLCVSVPGPSGTEYRLPGEEKIHYIESKENLMVLSRSDGDLHRSTECQTREPRITIAFDIIPRSSLKPDGLLNHWIPI